MPDLNAREIALLVPLAVLMVWIGIAPASFLEPSETATEAIVRTVEVKRMAIEKHDDEEGFRIAVDEFGPWARSLEADQLASDQ